MFVVLRSSDLVSRHVSCFALIAYTPAPPDVSPSPPEHMNQYGKYQILAAETRAG